MLNLHDSSDFQRRQLQCADLWEQVTSLILPGILKNEITSHSLRNILVVVQIVCVHGDYGAWDQARVSRALVVLEVRQIAMVMFSWNSMWNTDILYLHHLVKK